MICRGSRIDGKAIGRWLSTFPVRWWLRLPEWLDGTVKKNVNV